MLSIFRRKSEFIRVVFRPLVWIPACAGVTVYLFIAKRETLQKWIELKDGPIVLRYNSANTIQRNATGCLRGSLSRRRTAQLLIEATEPELKERKLMRHKQVPQSI